MTRRETAVVTGAAGFLGSHMVELLLSEGVSVRGIDNLSSGRIETLEMFKGDPRYAFDSRDLRDVRPGDPVFEGADYVFHFAGVGDIVPSIERPTEYLSANVQGTVHALEAARAADVKKFVYAASSSCYGPSPPVPTREDAPIDPHYPYALSKYLGELAAFHWHRVYGFPVVSIRIFNAYGTRSRTSGAYGAVFGVFLAQKLARRPFTVVGDGTQTRDFVHAHDVARAFHSAARSNRSGEVYNLGAGQPQSVNRLVTLLGGPVVYVPKRPGEPECTWADTTKIRRDLGWEPRVSFEDGVAEMVRNIEFWKNAPVWDPPSIEAATRKWFAYLGRATR